MRIFEKIHIPPAAGGKIVKSIELKGGTFSPSSYYTRVIDNKSRRNAGANFTANKRICIFCLIHARTYVIKSMHRYTHTHMKGENSFIRSYQRLISNVV